MQTRYLSHHLDRGRRNDGGGGRRDGRAGGSHGPEQSVVEVTIRYAEANECYTVRTSPIKSDINSGSFPNELRELNQRIAKHLPAPGRW